MVRRRMEGDVVSSSYQHDDSGNDISNNNNNNVKDTYVVVSESNLFDSLVIRSYRWLYQNIPEGIESIEYNATLQAVHRCVF